MQVHIIVHVNVCPPPFAMPCTILFSCKKVEDLSPTFVTNGANGANVGTGRRANSFSLREEYERVRRAKARQRQTKQATLIMAHWLLNTLTVTHLHVLLLQQQQKQTFYININNANQNTQVIKCYLISANIRYVYECKFESLWSCRCTMHDHYD